LKEENGKNENERVGKEMRRRLREVDYNAVGDIRRLEKIAEVE
jgi:hypothetical protein